MSNIKIELELAYARAPGTRLFTLSPERWLEYYSTLNEKVRDSYEHDGYFEVLTSSLNYPTTKRVSAGSVHRLRAVTYRAIPVVMRTDYDRVAKEIYPKELKWQVVHL